MNEKLHIAKVKEYLGMKSTAGVKLEDLVVMLYNKLYITRKIPIHMELPYPLYPSVRSEWLSKLCKFIPKSSSNSGRKNTPFIP